MRADPSAAALPDRYAALHRAFRWQVPPHFNIAEVCCGRWARETPTSVAIRFYERMGASVLPDWRIGRISGEGLAAFAVK